LLADKEKSDHVIFNFILWRPHCVLKYIIKEYNPSTQSFNVAIVDCSNMFRLPHSNHHLTVYQKYMKEIILTH